MNLFYLVASAIVVLSGVICVVVVVAVILALAGQSGAEHNRPLPTLVQERLSAVARKENSNGNQ